jgi:hypothetical protein
MVRLLRTAVLATAVMTVAAPAALADSSEWRTRTMECSVGTMTFLLPPSEFVTAFVPFHDAASGAVLTPLKVTVDGDVYVSKPLAANGGDRLVTCGYTDPAGLVIQIVGRLTPSR